jgi:hypothetical protein
MSRGEKQFRKKSLREILFGRNYFEGAIQEILSGGIRDFLDVHEDPGNKKAHPLLTDVPERVKIECDLWQLLRKNSQI